MLIQIFLFLGLALVVAYFWRASKNVKQKPQPVSRKSSKTPNPKPAQSHFRSVVIAPGLNPCKAIYAYKGKHLLMNEAPTLPIKACDAKLCGCKFIRYDDRRTEDRRTVMKAAANQILSEHNNKRERKDRRKPKV